MSDEKKDSNRTESLGIGQFAVRLKDAIGESSVRSIAAKAGVSEGAVRNLLSEGTPRLDTVLQLADVLGVSFQWLATGEGPMHSSDHRGSRTGLTRYADRLADRLSPEKPATNAKPMKTATMIKFMPFGFMNDELLAAMIQAELAVAEYSPKAVSATQIANAAKYLTHLLEAGVIDGFARLEPAFDCLAQALDEAPEGGFTLCIPTLECSFSNQD